MNIAITLATKAVKPYTKSFPSMRRSRKRLGPAKATWGTCGKKKNVLSLAEAAFNDFAEGNTSLEEIYPILLNNN